MRDKRKVKEVSGYHPTKVVINNTQLCSKVTGFGRLNYNNFVLIQNKGSINTPADSNIIIVPGIILCNVTERS